MNETKLQKLVLRPSRWQQEAMTFVPLVICGAFAATAWFIMGEVWRHSVSGAHERVGVR